MQKRPWERVGLGLLVAGALLTSGLVVPASATDLVEARGQRIGALVDAVAPPMQVPTVKPEQQAIVKVHDDLTKGISVQLPSAMRGGRSRIEVSAKDVTTKQVGEDVILVAKDQNGVSVQVEDNPGATRLVSHIPSRKSNHRMTFKLLWKRRIV